MEPLIGHDFSKVRVDTGTAAAESAHVMNAVANSVGNDVIFGASQHAPQTRQGQMLLGHELLHVEQQGAHSPGALNDSKQAPVAGSVPEFERQADQTAELVAAGERVQAFARAPVGLVQRQGIPGISDKGQLCGDFSEFLRLVKMDDLAQAGYILPDAINCFCLAAGVADVIPLEGIGNNPVIESIDCICNVLTFLQELYNRGNKGGCYSLSNLSSTDITLLGTLAAATAADCFSLPIGSAVGGLIGALLGFGGGSAGGPPGEAVGAIGGAITGASIGDFIVDVGGSAIQNLITQGVPWPAAQAQACSRFVNWAGNLELPTEGLTLQRSPSAQRSYSAQRSLSDSAGISEQDPIPGIVREVLSSSGQPLDAVTRLQMEPHFGHDFSRVQVHTDSRAASSAASIHALAYTVGRDIVFAAGQYTPGTSTGRRLLAHELTHVVQQEGSPSMQPALRLGKLQDDFEQEADRVSERVEQSLSASTPYNASLTETVTERT
jgi:hypothetical protein